MVEKVCNFCQNEIVLIKILATTENTTPASINASSPTELSLDESQPAINPDETTMWSVTLNRNETSEATAESSTEDYGTRFNETSTTSNPTSVDISSLSYKQSNYSHPISSKVS